MPGLKEWLAKASGNLKVAKLISRDPDNIDILDVAVNNTHQCAEKALKTYLVFCNKPVLKTHDLQKLLEVCSQTDPLFSNLLDDILTLNLYGVYPRYPDDRFSINQEDTQEAIDKATKVLRFVEKKIKSPINETINLFSK